MVENMNISSDRIRRIIPRLKHEVKKKVYYIKYACRIMHPKNKRIRYTSKYLRENINRVFVFKSAPSFETIKSNKKLYEDIIQAADKTVNDELYILHQYYNNLRNPNGHYKWHTDIFSGYTYPVKYKDYYTSAVFETDKQHHQDLKGPWEMSRLQFTVAPAIAWNLTEKDEYADKVIEILLDWIDVNILDEGPNWKNAMEAGIRVVNMLLAYQLIIDYKRISDKAANTIMRSIKEHLYYILWNLENYAGKTYNHYLGDIIGILAITASCPFLPNANNIYEEYKKEFEIQIERQILGDGGDFEGSTCYHCLVGEIFTLAAVIIKNHGESVSDKYISILKRMIIFSKMLQKPRTGFQPQIGDNDGGRVIEIVPHAPLDYSWFINMASSICGEGFIDDYQSALQSFLIQDNKINSANTDNLSNGNAFCFPEFGVTGYSDAHLYCLLSATEAQRYGLGGHTHNDKLSVELSVDGVDFIADPGSGRYTSDFKVHRALRSILFHSTVIVDGREQNIKQCESFFGNSHETECIINMPKYETDHINLNGYIQSFGSNDYRHERTISIYDKDTIWITDNVFTKTKKENCLRINFSLAPDVEVTVNMDEAVLSSKGITVRLKINNASWKVEESLYSPTYGKTVQSHKIYFDYIGDCEKKELVTVIKIEKP